MGDELLRQQSTMELEAQEDLRFNVLGPVEVFHRGRLCTPTAPKVRGVLALLLMRANRLVETSALIEELWGDRPPQSAVTTTQTYIYHLRKLFAREIGPEGERIFVTRPPGYLVEIGAGQLDMHVFEHQVEQGRNLLATGRPAEAAQLLAQALRLWRGPALANVAVGQLLEGSVANLEEQRLQATQLRIEACLQLGRHRELIAEMRTLVAQHPLNEWFHAKLILALSRSGRRSESLAVYQHLRHTLDQELGLSPSQELQRLQHEVLTQDAV